MGTEKVYFIINPDAGSASESENFTLKVREAFPDARLLVTNTTTGADVLARQAMEAGCDLIVAGGGDGTLHEVINAVAGGVQSPRVGLLPLGTANDFARSIGVPEDLSEALEVLLRNRTLKIDVVRIHGARIRHMINVSAGGFGALVDEKMTPDMKDRWGILCYARSFLEALSDVESYQATITCDNEPPIQTEVCNLLIANARFVAGGIPIAPKADLTDGLMDAVIVPIASMPQLALLTGAALLGRHLESESLIFRQARRVQITTDRPVRFNADGELLESSSQWTFEVLPGAVEFVVGELPAVA